VSRLTHQKGSDLLAALAPALPTLPAQLVVQGRGDGAYERALQDAARAAPRSVAVDIVFDEALAHLIEGGADAFLMPSRFEPCGLNQMYSQRYGTPPIAHRTGGLADSIVDATPAALADGTASGFLFDAPTLDALREAVTRAIALYRNPHRWRALQQAGMRMDFGWSASARRYLAVYRALARAEAG
jgi:starch synthase